MVLKKQKIKQNNDVYFRSLDAEKMQVSLCDLHSAVIYRTKLQSI